MSAIDSSTPGVKMNVDLFAADLCAPGAVDPVYNTEESGDSAETSYNPNEINLGANEDVSESQVFQSQINTAEDKVFSQISQEKELEYLEYDNRLRA